MSKTTSSEEVTELAGAQPATLREDLTVYLTARAGAAECFVSYNHELIAALAAVQQQFESLTPAGVVGRYLSEPAPT